MTAWQLVGRTGLPDGAALELWWHGEDEFSIRVDGSELMGTTEHTSEDALAALTCARLVGRPAPRVLVGGLGMGFTLGATLAHLGPDGEVVVAELFPEVVRWNREVLGGRRAEALADPRVAVHQVDVSWLIRGVPRIWDAILLDVDNGPEAFTTASNHWLYGPAGLDAAFEALRPGGVLGVWSCGSYPAFTRRLRRAGFQVETVRVPLGRGTRHHVVWLATRPG